MNKNLVPVKKTWTRHLSFENLWASFSFLLACLVAWSIELAVEHKVDDPLAGRPFSVVSVYHRIVTGGPRKPAQKYTVLIDTRAKNDQYFDSLTDGVINRCDRRRPLADLLKSVASARPAVIVLDYTFHQKQCAEHDEATEYLQKTIGELSILIPIVIGRRFEEDKEHLQPSVAFPKLPGSGLRFGVIAFDVDTNKLPLNWPVYSENPGSQPETLDTLALSTAKAFNMELENKYPKLRTFLRGTNPHNPSQATHPYISFIPQDELTIHPAGAFLCGPKYASTPHSRAQGQCETTPQILQKLRGRIVVIGATNLDDMHESAIGKVAGYVLQTNYIEALLDERYFMPAPELIDYALGLLLFAAILYASRKAKKNWRILWCVAIVFLAYLIVYIVLILFGYYINPATVSVLALIFNFVHMLIESVEDFVHRLANFLKGKDREEKWPVP
jgi:CHASE2 domain-containing sensor protein